MIATERLILRKPRLGDAQPINDAINRSLTELTPWMPWAKDPSLKPTQQYVDNSIKSWGNPQTQREFQFVVELKDSGTIIFATGYNEKSQPEIPLFEIGYWIDTQHAGKGYVTEAVSALTQLAFDYYKAVRVQICCQVDNIKSSAVAERCGFIKEAILKNYRLDCTSGKPCDETIYACFSKEQLTTKVDYELSI